MENDLDDIARRNDALLFRTIPERATATAKFTMSDVKVPVPFFRSNYPLNQMCEATQFNHRDKRCVHYYDSRHVSGRDGRVHEQA